MTVPAAPGLEDAFEVLTGNGLVCVLAHVAARPDSIPRLHGTVLLHSCPQLSPAGDNRPTSPAPR